ncbi:MAG TPA: hypothetical protein VJ824_04890 [Bacillota bacterium]|nr:hypothetical protein [Bacillota bacterium]
MKKIITILSALTLVGTVTLTGCSSTPTPSASPSTNKEEPAKEKAPAAATSVKEGLAKLLQTAKQIKKAADKGDEAKIKENGPKLEEIWGSFEDDVKAKYADSYEKIEKALDPTIAATKANPIDKTTLLKIDNQLIDSLYELSGKVIPVDEIKAGATKMLDTTSQLKQAIQAGDTAKVKELGPKLEETWSTFEDGVKPRNPEMYEKLEKPLNPEVAGSQVSPLDKETLGKLNDELIGALNELLKNIK